MSIGRSWRPTSAPKQLTTSQPAHSACSDGLSLPSDVDVPRIPIPNFPDRLRPDVNAYIRAIVFHDPAAKRCKTAASHMARTLIERFSVGWKHYWTVTKGLENLTFEKSMRWV